MNNYKDLLKRMKLESIRERSPGFFELSGRYKLKVAPYSDTTANGLTACIVDFINHLPGGIGEASRISSTGMPRKMADGSTRWTTGSTRKGIADIRATVHGRSLSIEVKIGRDRQSEAQVKEQDRIMRAGGIYIIATSFPQFLEQWQAAGFPVPEYSTSTT